MRRFLKVFGLGFFGLALAGSVTATTVPSLGAAGGYAVFALNSFTLSGGGGAITGNVAVGQSASTSSPGTITGTVFLNSAEGAKYNGNIVPSGGTKNVDLSAAITAAQNAPAQYNALTATQTFSGGLSNNSSITGNGGVNVIDVNGIDLTNGTLTLNGGANDIFIINDTGDFKFSNSDMVLNGVSASHILFNVSGNTAIAITGGGPVNFYGTILDPFGDVQVHDKNLTGEIIGKTVEDTSGFDVTNTPFTPPSNVPEPATYSTAVGALVIIGALGWRRRRSA
jgi:hypothetical protein